MGFLQKSQKISQYPKNKKLPINSKKTFVVPKWAILSKFLIKITPPKPYMNFQKKILKLFFLLGGSQKSKKALKNDQKIKKETKNGSKTLFFIIMTPANMDIRIWKPFLFFQKSQKFRRYLKKLKITHKFQKKLFCAKMGNPIKNFHKNDPPETLYEFSEKDTKTFFLLRGSQKSKKTPKKNQKKKKKKKKS